MDSVGQLLAQLREEKGLSQAELAKLVGTTANHICDLERGKPGSIALLAKLAVVLDVPLEEVWLRGNRPEP
ncbi:Helix-turn-helix domain protein [Acididesulfobacillus acetoxydans]|uniref:Cro/C1-type HTH domain profile n=1 Tax=Acididesulfobacillus acetoxydans TaxID=1561005 RepID=A0A8S0WRI6_9FIRM|nr:helix-turn-helix transcriptional regulator [Acididesulfobacillus acetoxydans]CAA7603324.1 Helix-turn-helix domain protein [Acididesulfobacillus acetoxydans]CEJ09667.1 Cro/C1-type HTH domain profile [Acididesulfobacillus acetoxydans]